MEETPDVKFSEKEVKMLVAMAQCLKSGPPEIDMAKFTVAAGFNTPKTASNQWATLKKKLKEMNPVEEGEVTTPKSKAKGKSKRKAVKDEDGSEEDADAGETPKKKVRGKGKGKTRAKKEEEPMVESASEGEKADTSG